MTPVPVDRVSVPASVERPWMVAASASLGMYLTVLYIYSLGVMIEPLEREFGWSRANIAAGGGIVSIVAILGNPFIGTVLDRIGARRIALSGIVFYCVAFASLGTSGPDLLGWRLRWVLIASASVLISTPVWMAGVSSRFHEQRGLAIGIAAMGAALSAATVPYITNSLLLKFGWRETYQLLAAFGFTVCFVPALCFFVDAGSASSLGTRAAPSNRKCFARQNSLKNLLLSRPFAAIAMACLLVTAGIVGVVVHFVPIVTQNGIDRSTAVAIAGVIGLSGIGGRLVTGYLLDKIQGRFVAAVAFVVPVAASLLCATCRHSVIAAFMAATALGVALGAETDCTAYLTARYFGLRNYGTVYGIFSGIISAGAGIGPIIAGWIYDRTGSYDYLLFGIIPAFVAGAFLMIGAGPYTETFEQ